MVRRSLFARLFGRRQEDGGGTATATATSRVVGSRSKELGREMSASAPASRLSGGHEADRPVNGDRATEEKSSASPVEPVSVARVSEQTERPERAEVRGVKSTKLAPQEELSLKISEGIHNLSGLLTSIDEKLLEQNQQRDRLARRLDNLPGMLETLVQTQKSNLQATQAIGRAVEEQTRSGKATAETLGKLPAMVEGLGTRLDEHARAGLQVRDSVETVGKSVRNLSDGTQRAQNTLLAEFRRAQDEQRSRLEDLVDRERRTYYVVAALGLAVVVCLVAMLVKLSQ